MCGLIGEWSWQGSAQPLPLVPLAHRGPDGQGGWSSAEGHCWLGHTRLAIQDRSAAGAQPIASHCGRFMLVFNGEIYNHLSLRPELPGVPWRGHSDSETLVEALAQQGLAVLSRLRGMYAFAAYDGRLRRLWLGRDPLGIKPLYLAQRHGTLRFASERQALGWPTPLQPREVAEVLSWGHLLTPVAVDPAEAPSVSSLPPGALVEIRADRPQRLASVQPAAAPVITACVRTRSGAARQLRNLLEQSVQEHLLADVPVACFLSAGLDSGILAALACRAAPGSISTFTVSFPGMAIDEGERAAAMARHCGSDHHPLTLTASQVLLWVEQALAALDVPTADGLNTYLISRAVAEQGLRVALSGLGADELFGGYPSHRLVPWLSLLRGLPPGLRRSVLMALVPRLGSKLLDLPNWDPWLLAQALRRWASNSDLRAAGLPALIAPTPPAALPRQRWPRISSAELTGYTEPMLLRDSDVLSMACGLEVRVPFLDQRLQQLVWALPSGVLRPGKTLLREACADLFPPGYLHRPKQGFTLPMAAWMQGPLRQLCQSRLRCLAASGWLQPSWLEQQWQRFEAGQLNWPRAWSLVVLGEFASRQPNDV
jgi:asparagine synthase (glutamine-hydrolysing)